MRTRANASRSTLRCTSAARSADRDRHAPRAADRGQLRQWRRVHLARVRSVAWAHQVRLDFSRPGKPTDNAMIEAFNARVRREYPFRALLFESRPSPGRTQDLPGRVQQPPATQQLRAATP